MEIEKVSDVHATRSYSCSSSSAADTDSSTFPARAREIGHPTLVASAAASKAASSEPGTTPTTSIRDAVTDQPSPTLSNVTSADTWRWSGGVPARTRLPDSAIEKQLAWAAASSSSGEVLPAGASVREDQETGRSVKSPVVPAVTLPEPSASEPLQVAVAVRVAAIDTVLLLTVDSGADGQRTRPGDGSLTSLAELPARLERLTGGARERAARLL